MIHCPVRIEQNCANSLQIIDCQDNVICEIITEENVSQNEIENANLIVNSLNAGLLKKRS